MNNGQNNPPPDLIGTFLGGCFTLVFLGFVMAAIVTCGQWIISLF